MDDTAEMSIADRIARWREQPPGCEDEDYCTLLCDAEDELRKYEYETARRCGRWSPAKGARR